MVLAVRLLFVCWLQQKWILMVDVLAVLIVELISLLVWESVNEIFSPRVVSLLFMHSVSLINFLIKFLNLASVLICHCLMAFWVIFF
jgi:hypothetical protein